MELGNQRLQVRIRKSGRQIEGDRTQTQSGRQETVCRLDGTGIRTCRRADPPLHGQATQKHSVEVQQEEGGQSRPLLGRQQHKCHGTQD